MCRIYALIPSLKAAEIQLRFVAFCLRWEEGMAIIYGTNRNDDLFGDVFGYAEDDLIYGFGGNDLIDGGYWNDDLYGGFGNDGPVRLLWR